ncbi:expressed unknown protein [Seminavis robusta]|uniref:CRAL-TRIO domain-containing protein n=1 Tax=Seminavis robusta TaxID=568900 RepID=A0A9N8HBP2_9STRA|nr:expressed unknown protein [Seminavis robusta]|eukprot:Sro346_g122780.1 n/a (371) ;mRNA; f:69947-71268
MNQTDNAFQGEDFRASDFPWEDPTEVPASSSASSTSCASEGENDCSRKDYIENLVNGDSSRAYKDALGPNCTTDSATATSSDSYGDSDDEDGGDGKDGSEPEIQIPKKTPNVATSRAIARNSTANTDMMYAQLAIVGDGDIEWAISKAYQMQKFKQEYALLDTVEDCLRHIPGLVKDGFLLSVDFNLHQGGYIMAGDMPKFDFSLCDSSESLCGLKQRSYYLPQILCPDLAAVRAGITGLLEFDGYGRALNNFTFRTFATAFRESTANAYDIYPAKHAQFKFFNTPRFVNLAVALVKPMLSKNADSIKLGCKFPGGRLDSVFNVPNEEAAVARLRVKLEELIMRRYDNEKKFSLENVPADGQEVEAVEST